MYKWHLVTDGDKSKEFKIKFWNQPKKGLRKSCTKRVFLFQIFLPFSLQFFGIFVELIFQKQKAMPYISTYSYVINAPYTFLIKENQAMKRE